MLITGYIKDTTSNFTGPIFLIKADANGNTLWEKRYTSFMGGIFRDMIIEDNGSITGAGEILLPAGGYSGLMHLDSMGNFLWGWYSYNNLSFPQVIKADDGGYMLTTLLYPDLLKTDSTGSVGCWEYALPAPTVSTGLLFTTDTLTVEPLFPTRHSINLYIHNAPPFQDTTFCYGYMALQGQLVKEKNKVSVYPNPANAQIVVELPANVKTVMDIYNSMGSKQYSEVIIQSSKQNKTVINVSHLPNGIYLIQLTGDKLNESIKFYKQ